MLVASLQKEDGKLASPVLDILSRFGNVTVVQTSYNRELITPYEPTDKYGRKQLSSGIRRRALPKKGVGFYMNPAGTDEGSNDKAKSAPLFSVRCLQEIQACDAVIALLTYGATEIGFLISEATSAKKKVLILAERFAFLSGERFGFFRGLPSIEVAEFSSDTPHLQLLLQQFLSSVGATRVG